MLPATPTDGDDPSIGAEEIVLRRVKSQPSMVVTDSLTGAVRPSSGAFTPDDDGISVYRELVLRDVGCSPVDLTTDASDLVYGLEVGDVRRLDLGVRGDPWPPGIPDETHPRNAAHALIVGLAALSRSERKRKQSGLVAAPSLSKVIG